MVRFLEERTPVQFYAVRGMPDYHPEFPGGKPGGGRTIECPLFPFARARAVGAARHAVAVHPRPHHDERDAAGQPRPRSRRRAEELAAPRGRQRARLRAGPRPAGSSRRCLDRGVEPRDLRLAGTELLIEDGRGRRRPRRRPPTASSRCGPRVGVILATGGFEWNPEYVRAFLRGPMTHPVSMPDLRRRRPAHGDEGRRHARQHARGVVDPRGGRAQGGQLDWAAS